MNNVSVMPVGPVLNVYRPMSMHHPSMTAPPHQLPSFIDLTKPPPPINNHQQMIYQQQAFNGQILPCPPINPQPQYYPGQTMVQVGMPPHVHNGYPLSPLHVSPLPSPINYQQCSNYSPIQQVNQMCMPYFPNGPAVQVPPVQVLRNSLPPPPHQPILLPVNEQQLQNQQNPQHQTHQHQQQFHHQQQREQTIDKKAFHNNDIPRPLLSCVLIEPEAPANTTSNLDSWNNAVIDMDRMMAVRAKVGLLINKRYQVNQKVSFGSYGTIYTAIDIKDPSTQVAVKFETSMEDTHLHYEYDVYKVLANGTRRRKKKGQPITGVPKVYWYGEEYGQRMLVMSLLGPSLENLFTYCDRIFCRQTICALGLQMLDRLQWLHDRGFVHRDLKPENFLMGIGEDENILFLIDFGLARRYRFRDGERLTHIPHRKGKNLVGTAKYASLNSHLGMELSRRDDLESLSYIMAELCCGELPWKESKNKTRFRTKQQSYNRIRNIKESIDWNVFCPPLAEMVAYTRSLEFTEDPDYDRIVKILENIVSWEGGEDSDSNKSKNSSTDEPPLKEESEIDAPTDDSSARTSCDKDPKNNMMWNETEMTRRNPGRLFRKCKWMDNSKKFNWIVRRDSSIVENYRYNCLFKWTHNIHGENA